MPLPRKPYADWTPEDLALLVADDPAEESARLDFKKTCSLLADEPKAKRKARFDLLKDVAAMANSLGGALLIGVDQDRDPDTPPVAKKLRGIDKGHVEPLKAAIAELVDKHLQVRPAALILRDIGLPSDPSKSILIVQVPANTFSLSMITLDDLNQYWVRRGTNNRLMTPEEIRQRFQEEQAQRGAAEGTLAEARSQVLEIGGGASSCWFIGVPLAREQDSIPVDLKRLERVIKESKYYDTYREGDRKSPYWGPVRTVGYLAPALRGIETTQGRCRLIAHQDGTMIYVVTRLDNGAERGKSIHLGNLIYEPWCSALYLFRDLQMAYGLSPVALVQPGLTGVQGCSLQRRGEEAMVFEDDDIPMGTCLTQDAWSPEEVFTQWTKRFANYWGKEDALVSPPWVREGEDAE